MGYINCDRFPDEPKIQFMVAADDSIVAEYFVVFDNVRGVIKDYTSGHIVAFDAIQSDKKGTSDCCIFSGK
jgi:hypothetical protein